MWAKVTSVRVVSILIVSNANGMSKINHLGRKCRRKERGVSIKTKP